MYLEACTSDLCIFSFQLPNSIFFHVHKKTKTAFIVMLLLFEYPVIDDSAKGKLICVRDLVTGR
jgi:hypothetical protein